MTAHLVRMASSSEQSATSRLFEPSYQNRLRIVGHTLDRCRLEQAVILDLGDSIVLRAHDPEADRMVSEMFPDAGLREAMEAIIYGGRFAEPTTAPSAALRPTGYEDFLRALGYRLDRQNAQSVTIVECPRYIHVSGMERIGPEDETAMVPFCFLFEAPKVNSLVNEAVSRRESSSLAGGLSVKRIETGQLGRVMHSSGLSR